MDSSVCSLDLPRLLLVSTMPICELRRHCVFEEGSLREPQFMPVTCLLCRPSTPSTISVAKPLPPEWHESWVLDAGQWMPHRTVP